MSLIQKVTWYLKHNFSNTIGKNPQYRAWQQRKITKKQANILIKDSDYPSILVYQMGKVGSTTIFNSLQQANLPNSIAQVHFLSDHVIKNRNYEIKIGNFPPSYHMDLGLAINEKFKQLRNRKPFFKLISLVRDPIAFQISNFFQNPHYFPSELRDDLGNVNLKKTNDFLNNLLLKEKTFDYVFNWFDREIKTVFNLDIFEFPFDKNKGWTILKGDNVELLLIRMENLSTIDNQVLTDFVGSEKPIKLINSNVRSKTNKNYETVKNNINLDRKVCEKIYSHRLVQHFYDQDDIERFIDKWCNGDKNDF